MLIAPPRDLTSFPVSGAQPCTPTPVPRPPREPRGAGPVSQPSLAMIGPAVASFREDIQMVMSALRTVKSSEISEFARELCSCRNVEDKLNILVKHHHLMVKLEHM
ncbi:hypothetical protein EVAR_52134_1 [Eumeta japonica]|uniref:Uncharacterized protein n=1 Tax=Eumeta variegata TaxID=151549 RepID=A0A4C1XQC1_EUMVA|nr:hypothetical protein EVAR_52134_1 [Eumeta japonica]